MRLRVNTKYYILNNAYIDYWPWLNYDWTDKIHLINWLSPCQHCFVFTNFFYIYTCILDRTPTARGNDTSFIDLTLCINSSFFYFYFSSLRIQREKNCNEMKNNPLSAAHVRNVLSHLMFLLSKGKTIDNKYFVMTQQTV